jgi:hypothetical protein
MVGHAQRNFAIDLIQDGHIYMNDDDTTIHSELWKSIKDIDNDFISFSQINKDGSIRIKGDYIGISGIDSHNFIVSSKIGCKFRWVVDKYEADGIFAMDCYSISTSKIFIDKVLSVYNLLR